MLKIAAAWSWIEFIIVLLIISAFLADMTFQTLKLMDIAHFTIELKNKKQLMVKSQQIHVAFCICADFFKKGRNGVKVRENL